MPIDECTSQSSRKKMLVQHTETIQKTTRGHNAEIFVSRGTSP